MSSTHAYHFENGKEKQMNYLVDAIGGFSTTHTSQKSSKYFKTRKKTVITLFLQLKNRKIYILSKYFSFVYSTFEKRMTLQNGMEMVKK